MNRKNTVSEEELKKLVDIYSQLQEPDRNIFVMGGNLLLASQLSKKRRKSARRTG